MSDPRIHDAGELWDASDGRALWALLAEGLTHTQIAQRLGRTVVAVRSKLYRLRKADQ